MSKRMSDLIDTYRDAVSQRVAFNSPEHRAAETAAREALLGQSQTVSVHRFTPSTCPHCEYDRRFPDFEGGGWMQQDNNGPIVSCPMCNDDGAHPRSPQVSVAEGK